MGFIGLRRRQHAKLPERWNGRTDGRIDSSKGSMRKKKKKKRRGRRRRGRWNVANGVAAVEGERLRPPPPSPGGTSPGENCLRMPRGTAENGISIHIPGVTNSRRLLCTWRTCTCPGRSRIAAALENSISDHISRAEILLHDAVTWFLYIYCQTAKP